jgi:hypothetical protein
MVAYRVPTKECWDSSESNGGIGTVRVLRTVLPSRYAVRNDDAVKYSKDTHWERSPTGHCTSNASGSDSIALRSLGSAEQHANKESVARRASFRWYTCQLRNQDTKTHRWQGLRYLYDRNEKAILAICILPKKRRNVLLGILSSAASVLVKALTSSTRIVRILKLKVQVAANEQVEIN